MGSISGDGKPIGRRGIGGGVDFTKGIRGMIAGADGTGDGERPGTAYGKRGNGGAYDVPGGGADDARKGARRGHRNHHGRRGADMIRIWLRA